MLSAMMSPRRALGALPLNTTPTSGTSAPSAKKSPRFFKSSSKMSASKPQLATTPTPMSVEAVGTRGIFQAKPGPAPAEVEVFGLKGVFGSVRGPAPSKAAAVAQGREAEYNSEGVRAFLASHTDAELLPGGVVRCTKTRYEMPARLEDMEAHWKGRRYRRGYTTERKRREPAAKAEEQVAAPLASPTEGKARKKKKGPLSERRQRKAAEAQAVAEAVALAGAEAKAAEAEARAEPAAVARAEVEAVETMRKEEAAGALEIEQLAAKVRGARALARGEEALRRTEGAQWAESALRQPTELLKEDGSKPVGVMAPLPDSPEMPVHTPRGAAAKQSEVRAAALCEQMFAAEEAEAAEEAYFESRAEELRAEMQAEEMRDAMAAEEAMQGSLLALPHTPLPGPVLKQRQQHAGFTPVEKPRDQLARPKPQPKKSAAPKPSVLCVAAQARRTCPHPRAPRCPHPTPPHPTHRTHASHRRCCRLGNPPLTRCAPCLQALSEPEAQPTPRRANPELQSAAAAWLVAAEAASVKVVAEEPATLQVASELSAASIRNMKVSELRDALVECKLPTDGLKPALAARLLQHCCGAAPPPGTPGKPAAAATPSKATAKTPGSTLRSRAMRSTTKR